MAVITKPADFTGAVVTVLQLNTLKNTIYDAFGTTTNNQGSIDNANIAVAAGIDKSKILDTGLVSGNGSSPGTQTVTRPTTFSGSLLMTLGLITSGQVPSAAGVGRMRMTYSGAQTITGFQGGTEGQFLFVISTNANATIANNSASAAPGIPIYTNTGVNKVLTANLAYLFIQDNAFWHEV